MRMIAVAALSGVLWGLAACSGEGSEKDAATEEETAARVISDSLVASQDQEGTAAAFRMGRGQADCIGEGFVDEIGVTKLQEYGLITEDLSQAGGVADLEMAPADAKAAAGTFFECADVAEMMTSALEGDKALDDRTRACLADALSEDVLRETFTLMFSGRQDEAVRLTTGPMRTCLTS